MKQKAIRLSSLFLAMLMLLSAILPSGIMTVRAASSLKAALKEESGNGILTVTVHSKALESGNEKEMYNTASATCWNIKNDGKKADDDAESHINSADLSIDKVIDKYEYEIGDTAHFTVKVKNAKGIANNVVITDTLPDGMVLKADTLKIACSPTTVTYHIAGTADPTNQLNLGKRLCPDQSFRDRRGGRHCIRKSHERSQGEDRGGFPDPALFPA